MSSTRTATFRRTALDHFEPEATTDPQAQRRLRGQLEQIDYTAYASNREVIAAILGPVDSGKVQRLAVAAATARAQWVAAAIAATDTPHRLSAEEVARLAQLRATFEELTEVYEALRRTIERGYVAYKGAE